MEDIPAKCQPGSPKPEEVELFQELSQRNQYTDILFQQSMSRLHQKMYQNIADQ